MFEKATRQKLRFLTLVGNLTTEDLWELPLTNPRGPSLDILAKDLNRQLKTDGEESFVVQKSNEDSVLNLKFSIVKHVIKIKLDEAITAGEAAATAAKKEKILSILADKEDETLKGKSADELKSLLAEL